MENRNIIFGALGTEKDDKGEGDDRWDEWRPTVDLCLHPDLPIARYELFYQKEFNGLVQQVKADIESRTSTSVLLHKIDFKGMTCSPKITPGGRQESNRMEKGDSCYEEGTYGRADRGDNAWV